MAAIAGDSYHHLSTNDLILCPPPAPRKVYVHKKINVSSRVRRRLNFDDSDDMTAATPKKMRLAPAAELRLSRPMTVAFTGETGASSDGEHSDDSSDGAAPMPVAVGQKTPTTTTTVRSRTSKTVAMNRTSLKFDDCTENGLLLVDDGGFTTPDKCVCKSVNMPVKVKPSFKRPLRLWRRKWLRKIGENNLN